MDTAETPISQIPEVTTDSTAPVSKKKDIWIIAGAVVLAGIITLITMKSLFTTPKIPTVQTQETPTPSPTPVRILSAIASQSAFLALEEAYSSFSASLTATNLDDPSLSPPVLDLPLGFR